MSLLDAIILGVVHGFAEILPISGFTHVIVAEKLLGINSLSAEATFFRILLQVGSMGAVAVFFLSRWRGVLSRPFIRMVVLASLCTGVLGVSAQVIFDGLFAWLFFRGFALAQAISATTEVDHAFKTLPLMSFVLGCGGMLVLMSHRLHHRPHPLGLTPRRAIIVGIVQAICLPMRGLPRTGVTIAAAMLAGVDRSLAAIFSFALFLVFSPALVIFRLYRLEQASGMWVAGEPSTALVGMAVAFISSLAALQWITAWLKQGKWQLFGYYCLAASIAMATFAVLGY
jgi:undecaprenyl-diphosphatase